MLPRAVSILLALAVAAGPAFGLNPSRCFSGSQDSPPDATIQSTVSEVQFGFHVLQNGRAINNLQKDQFNVYQDGQQVPEVTGFYEDRDLPIELALMIDTSGSMSKGFASEQDAAIDFLRRVMRPGIDHGVVATFSAHATLDLTVDGTSPASLRGIAMLRPAGLTALFDSICEAAAQIATTTPLPRRTRNALVLLSDGNDNYSMHSLEEAVAAAQNSNLVIYAVTAHRRKNVQWGDANLEKLAAATGGRVFYLNKFEQSEAIFAELEHEIRSQYTVTFRSVGNTCGFHSVRVEAADQSLQVLARAGFYRDCP